VPQPSTLPHATRKKERNKKWKKERKNKGSKHGRRNDINKKSEN
jgi:hypothetical protein